MDRYTAEAARASGPDIDDECPAWAMDRISALESLARDLHHAASARETPIGYEGEEPMCMFAEPSRLSPELEARARALLDLEPPGFDPSTEGP